MTLARTATLLAAGLLSACVTRSSPPYEVSLRDVLLAASADLQAIVTAEIQL